MENNLLRFRFFILICLAFLINSCCDKIASFNLAQTNYVEQTIEMKKGETITFWTYVDVEYSKEPMMVYSFKFYEGANMLFEGGVNPFNASLKEDYSLKTTKGKIKLSFKGKLEGNFKAKKEGVYTIKVHLIKNNSPQLILRNAKITFFKS